MTAVHGSDFSELLSEVRECRLCARSLALGPRPLVQAHAQASILIAGQAPGRAAHESGIPFDDPSGDRLRDWMGVSSAEFYDPRKVAVLPMGFCYPGSGRSGDKPPRPECAPAWREKLLAAMPHVRLTLVLGRYAQAYHLTPSRTVTDTVAAWRDSWPRILPLPHPSPRNRTWLKRNPWFASDVLPKLRVRVRELLGG